MRVDELIRRLRMFPPDAVVCYHVSLGRECDPLEGATLKNGRQVEKLGTFPRYKLGPAGNVKLVILR